MQELINKWVKIKLGISFNAELFTCLQNPPQVCIGCLYFKEYSPSPCPLLGTHWLSTRSRLPPDRCDTSLEAAVSEWIIPLNPGSSPICVLKGRLDLGK